jgi:hypothetical protein
MLDNRAPKSGDFTPRFWSPPVERGESGKLLFQSRLKPTC